MSDERRKILMCYEYVRGAWQVFFRTVPQPYIFPCRFVFGDSDKIRDLYLRYGLTKLSEDLAAFDLGITQGRGGVDLMLGPEQIAVLEKEKAPPGRVGLDATRRPR